MLGTWHSPKETWLKLSAGNRWNKIPTRGCRWSFCTHPSPFQTSMVNTLTWQLSLFATSFTCFYEYFCCSDSMTGVPSLPCYGHDFLWLLKQLTRSYRKTWLSLHPTSHLCWPKVLCLTTEGRKLLAILQWSPVSGVMACFFPCDVFDKFRSDACHFLPGFHGYISNTRKCSPRV